MINTQLTCSSSEHPLKQHVSVFEIVVSVRYSFTAYKILGLVAITPTRIIRLTEGLITYLKITSLNVKNLSKIVAFSLPHFIFNNLRHSSTSSSNTNIADLAPIGQMIDTQLLKLIA